MKYLVLILLLVACAEKQDDIIKQNANTPIVSKYTFPGIDGGAITKTLNGTLLVGGGHANVGVDVFASTDNGLTWSKRYTFPLVADKGGASTMITDGGIVYFSLESEVHNTGSQYHSAIWKSSDNGFTWVKVLDNDTYVISFSKVRDVSNRIAVSLNLVPQIGGYKQGIVDFGWFDPISETIEVVSRVATVGDEPGVVNDPSEGFYFRRPSDNAIIGAIRFGEAPYIPFLRLKVSLDEGLTWTTHDTKWAGYAGMASACVNSRGELWASGYYEPANEVAYSAVWQIDPESGAILQRLFPFTQEAGIRVGNGQIYCDNDSSNVFTVLMNGSLTFTQLSL